MTATPLPSVERDRVPLAPVEVVMKPTILRKADGSFEWIERPVLVSRDAAGKIVSEQFK